MTTIAYKHGVIATDRMACQGDTCFSTDLKMHIMDNDTVMAVSGDLAASSEFAEWYKLNHRKTHPFNPNCLPGEKIHLYAFVIRRIEMERLNDLVNYRIEIEHWHGASFFLRNPNDYCAEGCAKEYALGAMFMGASAIEAVTAASHHCVNSGYGILYANMFDPKLEIKKIYTTKELS